MGKEKSKEMKCYEITFEILEEGLSYVERRLNGRTLFIPVVDAKAYVTAPSFRELRDLLEGFEVLHIKCLGMLLDTDRRQEVAL